MLLAVALDRWEAMKVAWKANKADWGFDVEAPGQNGHLLGSAPEGPAVALLHSDVERREFISAGAAAGLAGKFMPLPTSASCNYRTASFCTCVKHTAAAHSERAIWCVDTNW